MSGVLRRLARSPEALAAPAASAPDRAGALVADPVGTDARFAAAFPVAFVTEAVLAAAGLVVAFVAFVAFAVDVLVVGRRAPVDAAISRSSLQPRPG
jgi:hypothetical protein